LGEDAPALTEIGIVAALRDRHRGAGGREIVWICTRRTPDRAEREQRDTSSTRRAIASVVRAALRQALRAFPAMA